MGTVSGFNLGRRGPTLTGVFCFPQPLPESSWDSILTWSSFFPIHHSQSIYNTLFGRGSAIKEANIRWIEMMSDIFYNASVSYKQLGFEPPISRGQATIQRRFSTEDKGFR